jgi:hypothetical protein
MFTGVICSHYDDKAIPTKLYYAAYGALRWGYHFHAFHWGISFDRRNCHVETILQVRRYNRFAIKEAFKEAVGTKLNDEVIAYIFKFIYGSYHDY